jgi:hypothetical protein
MPRVAPMIVDSTALDVNFPSFVLLWTLTHSGGLYQNETVASACGGKEVCLRAPGTGAVEIHRQDQRDLRRS